MRLAREANAVSISRLKNPNRRLCATCSSIGLDLGRWVSRGLLRFHPARPYLYGLETHLAQIHKQIDQFDPRVVVIDPITNLAEIGSARRPRRC